MRKILRRIGRKPKECERSPSEPYRRKERLNGRHGVILMGDALYACKAGLDICRDNGWHHLFVFKEGLENTFCADETASRAMHLLMQFAHNIWQVFNSGVLKTLSAGCRKVTQGMWGKKLCEALHYYDYSGTELETVYLNHAYEDAYQMTS